MGGGWTAQPPRRRSRGSSLDLPYAVLLTVGCISLVIILLAFGQLLAGTAPWSHVDAKARILGVYRYQPQSGRTESGRQHSFRPGQPFAARVDWTALPGTLQVGARWYDDGGQDWGGIQPATAAVLAGTPQASLVPMVRTDAPPGTYTVDVMRYSAGRPVQILGQTQVQVTS